MGAFERRAGHARLRGCPRVARGAGGPRTDRDQRRRWNTAVRHVNRYISPRGRPWRGGCSRRSTSPTCWKPRVLKTAVVAAAAHRTPDPAPGLLRRRQLGIQCRCRARPRRGLTPPRWGPGGSPRLH
ncbi:hypothetical protein QJS66_04660 [Kocuria rhizophila]|nr:hypothetical protein QJS66_04660 [Kocuria rhizophila]